ncbi:hypothetical protein B0H19DRAFT_1383420 [Mycena capillaripes]|nr:hypothetical protein B0H19DRAFT_1383420 [Mycena capillaripes]
MSSQIGHALTNVDVPPAPSTSSSTPPALPPYYHPASHCSPLRSANSLQLVPSSWPPRASAQTLSPQARGQGRCHSAVARGPEARGDVGAFLTMAFASIPLAIPSLP